MENKENKHKQLSLIILFSSIFLLFTLLRLRMQNSYLLGAHFNGVFALNFLLIKDVGFTRKMKLKKKKNRIGNAKQGHKSQRIFFIFTLLLPR